MTDNVSVEIVSTRNERQAQEGFAKVLRFRDLVTYGLVYIAPIAPWGTFAYVHSLSHGAVVLAYLAGLLCMVFTASSYKEMANVTEGAGSTYAYARNALGKRAGFLAGWMILLDYLLIPALMYVFAAVAMHALVPDVPRSIWVLGFAAFALLANWFGIAFTARLNGLFLIVQLVAVAGLMGWAMVHQGLLASFPADAILPRSFDGAGLFAAASICIMAFLGFDAITTLSQEVRTDQRHLLGRSILAVLAIIGVIAIVQVWVMAGLAKGYSFADLASGGYDLVTARVSPVAGSLMAWVAAIITGLAITPPMLSAVSRVLQAMAAAGELPQPLSRIEGKSGVPRTALIFASGVSICVALLFAADPEKLTSLVNFGALAGYAFVNISVIALFGIRSKSRTLVAHYLFPACGFLVIALVAANMSETAMITGLAWFALGCILLWRLRHVAKDRGSSPVDSEALS